MKKSRNLEKKQRLQPPVKSYEIAASCSPCWSKDYSWRQSFKIGTDLRLLVDTGATLTAISWELNKTLEKDLKNKFKPDDGYELTADNGWSLSKCYDLFLIQCSFLALLREGLNQQTILGKDSLTGYNQVIYISNSIITRYQLQNEDNHYTSPNSINEVLSSMRRVRKSKSLSNLISPSNWRRLCSWGKYKVNGRKESIPTPSFSKW